MDLRTTIEAIRHLEKDLVLYNVKSGNRITDQLKTFFDTQNVQISEAHTASGKPEALAILRNEEEVLAIVDVAVLRALVGDTPTTSADTGIADAPFEEILGHLKETTFTSYDKEQLIHASREIEDRARRSGRGTIHAGFQRCSLMAEQKAIYSDLADRGIEVHAYGVPDVPPPELGASYTNAVESDEISETWFVVFDGGGDETQKTAWSPRSTKQIRSTEGGRMMHRSLMRL